MSLSKNCVVNISGSHQNTETRICINERIRPLFNRVPTNSSFQFNISDVDSLVQGHLDIRSSCVCFVSTKRAGNVYEVIELIVEEVSEQIDSWINKRVV